MAVSVSAYQSTYTKTGFVPARLHRSAQPGLEKVLSAVPDGARIQDFRARLQAGIRPQGVPAGVFDLECNRPVDPVWPHAAESCDGRRGVLPDQLPGSIGRERNTGIVGEPL